MSTSEVKIDGRILRIGDEIWTVKKFDANTGPSRSTLYAYDAVPMSQRKNPEMTAASPASNVYLTTQEAAVLVRLSPRTLERMRLTGDGPKFHKVGPGKQSRVLYQREELEAWLTGFAFHSTSEYARR